MTPIVAPAAQAEIDDALTASRDPARLRAAIDAALATIGANPQIGARVGRTSAREYLLAGRMPYSIVYTETPAEIRVIAFVHGRRRRGYWKSRLPTP